MAPHTELHIAASARKYVSADDFGTNQLVGPQINRIEQHFALLCMHANSSGVDHSINFRGNSQYSGC